MHLVMTRDSFPQGYLQHCDKEMSPFMLEENVLYKLPLPFFFSWAELISELG